MSQGGANGYVTRCAVVAALGGLLFGFDTAVISGAEQTLARTFRPAGGLTGAANKFWHGFLVASALIGTVIGAAAAGRPADRLGRRAVMSLLAVLFLVSAVGSALAWDWYSFVFFRLVGGLGVGGASVVAPMYIAEVAPPASRGRLVALAQFNIVLGILVAFVSNYVIGELGLGESQWRWMLGVEAVPAAAYFVLLFAVPRSPRWLLAVGRESEARDALRGLRGADADAEVADIRRSLEAERDGLREPFFRRKYLKPILLAFAIAAFNQLSGINAVLYYSKRIFESAGFGESASLLNSVGIGAVNLVFTMAALAAIDRFGRRRLMLIGSAGYVLSLGTIALAFYTQSSLGVDAATGEPVREFTAAGGWVVFGGLVVFIAAHAFGQGAVIWVFISEIFPNRVRARGQALGGTTHWVFAALISQTFPLIAEASGGHIFAFYAACMVGQLLWVVFVMPETKGVPLERIQEQLAG